MRLDSHCTRQVNYGGRHGNNQIQFGDKCCSVIVIVRLTGALPMMNRQAGILNLFGRVFVLEADPYCINLSHQVLEWLQPHGPGARLVVL